MRKRENAVVKNRKRAKVNGTVRKGKEKRNAALNRKRETWIK